MDEGCSVQHDILVLVPSVEMETRFILSRCDFLIFDDILALTEVQLGILFTAVVCEGHMLD